VCRNASGKRLMGVIFQTSARDCGGAQLCTLLILLLSSTGNVESDEYAKRRAARSLRRDLGRGCTAPAPEEAAAGCGRFWTNNGKEKRKGAESDSISTPYPSAVHSNEIAGRSPGQGRYSTASRERAESHTIEGSARQMRGWSARECHAGRRREDHAIIFSSG